MRCVLHVILATIRCLFITGAVAIDIPCRDFRPAPEANQPLEPIFWAIVCLLCALSATAARPFSASPAAACSRCGVGRQAGARSRDRRRRTLGFGGKGGSLRRSRRYADSIYVSQCENFRNR